MLNLSISTLKGVGEKRKKDFLNLDINTIEDLLYYFPRQESYIDYNKAKRIIDFNYGERYIFKAQIMSVIEKKSFKGQRYALIRVRDETGYAEIYFFGKQIYKAKKLKNGMNVLVSGKIQQGKTGNKIVAEAMIDNINTEEEKGILPTYSLTGNMTQYFIRNLIKNLLSNLKEADVPEIIPKHILNKYRFISKYEAIKNIHYPKDMEILNKARQRLIFEELYIMQCGLLYYKSIIKNNNRGYKHGVAQKLTKNIFDIIPFKLTVEQKKAWYDIECDMENSSPMHRLLQGDVGSGKTIVSILAMLKAVENGFQAALMAPTEILAIQHFDTIKELLKTMSVKVALLTGSTVISDKKNILQDLENGKIDIIIGTHSLIQENVSFKELSLVITDEQHRFGVKQRAELTEKNNEYIPDALVMTATPIPRTMALTVYGDLDVSLIKELPPGRKPIKTLCYNITKREKVYEGLVRQINLGRQAYVVCPLIEDSEVINTVSASSVYEELKATFLKNIPVALLHGRMKASEKENIMNQFIKGDIKVLVSTTVIEVGINVPNASLIIVEGAERFGLAQLHQLRGRIGRGEHQSYCALISGSNSTQTMERLKLMSKYNDGFTLAEEDLKIRGAGAFFGTRQHGLPDLRIADIFKDIKLLLLARDCAKESIEDKTIMNEVIKAIKANKKFAVLFSA